MKYRTVAVVALTLMTALGVTGMASAQSSTTHTVLPGETLFSISRDYGISVNSLAFANGIINPNQIFSGQVLSIPGVTSAPASASSSTTSYTVVAGDTLFSIARRFGTDVSTLVTLNGLDNPNLVMTGQVLNVPAPGAAVTATPTPTATAAPTAESTYIVQPGDTLASIALRYGTTTQEIVLLNGLDDPNFIFAGEALLIP